MSKREELLKLLETLDSGDYKRIHLGRGRGHSTITARMSTDAEIDAFSKPSTCGYFDPAKYVAKMQKYLDEKVAEMKETSDA